MKLERFSERIRSTIDFTIYQMNQKKNGVNLSLIIMQQTAMLKTSQASSYKLNDLDKSKKYFEKAYKEIISKY